ELDEFAALGAQDRCPQYVVRLGIHDDLHEAGRLVALDDAGDPAHWDLADLEAPAGGPGLLLGHADAPELRVGEHGVGHEPAVGRELLAFDQVAVDDLVIVVGDVRECRAALDVAQGPDARHVRLQPAVDADEAVAVQLHPGVLQPQVVGVRAAAGG